MINTDIQINSIKGLPPEVFCCITQFLDVEDVLGLKQVCQDFYNKIQSNELQVFGDTERNRTFVAKKLLIELGHVPEVMAENAIKAMKKAGMQNDPETDNDIFESQVSKIKNIYLKLFEEQLPNTIKSYATQMTVHELLATRKFVATPAGKKFNSLGEEIQLRILEKCQSSEFQSKFMEIEKIEFND